MIESGEKATEIAVSFVKNNYSFLPLSPIKAARTDNTRTVEIDIGFFKTQIFVIKIDAESGNIIEYERK